VKRGAALGVFALGALASMQASAQGQETVQPISADARAEALFNAAKQLRDGGQLAEACPMFAASKQLAPGVGVTLHLADCYERMGRKASAWSQYREAEKLARDHGDSKRAEVAHARAQAIEPSVGRLSVAAPAGAHEGWTVLLDGAPLPPDMWNAPIAADSGDHVVTVNVPGQAARTLSTHVGDGNLVATVHLDDAQPGAVAAPAAAAAATESPPAAPSPNEPTSTEPASPSGKSNARTWGEISLTGVGAIGAGLGAYFLWKKNQMASENCDPQTATKRDSTAAAISFTVGGVALASAVALYLTTPGHQPTVGTLVAPAIVPGGGGMVLKTSF